MIEEKKEADAYNAELETMEDVCEKCAYNDEGFCCCFDRKSICCPYEGEEE